MSASLDKSLDDIISTGRKQRKSVPKKTGKNLVNRKKVAKQIVKRKPAPVVQKEIDINSATKVVVYGLPKDIKIDAVKDFFQSQVGSVGNIALSYNEKGQFKGIATIIFKTHAAANKAVEKYNGAPIDGGSSKLKLELIIDPTKRPLASRIGANSNVSTTPLKQRIQAKKALQVKPVAKKPAKKANNKPKAAAKPPKKSKKTVEELDQEMADYFEN